MKGYTHLSYQERERLANALMRGCSIGAAALEIGRNKSTVSRELKRNGGWEGYRAKSAMHRAKEEQRCREGITKLSKNPDLEAYSEEKLKLGWSPQVIAGRLKVEGRSIRISAEALYQWCYQKTTAGKELYKLLKRHKRKRGLRRTRAEKPCNKLKIAQRPAAARL